MNACVVSWNETTGSCSMPSKRIACISSIRISQAGPRYLVGLAELAAWLYPDASVPSGKRIHEEWANAAWMPMYKEDDGGQG